MKRLFWIIFLFILLPSALLSQTNLSLKSIADDLAANYYVKTLVYSKTESDARYPSATYFYSKTESDALLADKATTASVALKADLTYVNATDEAILLDNDSQDVQIEANRIAIDSAEVAINLNNIDDDSQDVAINSLNIDMDSAEAKINDLDIINDSQDVTIEAVRVKSDSTETGLDAHIDNLSNPHAVTALQTSYTDTYSIGATTVQAALDTIELWLSAIDVTDDSQDVAIEANKVGVASLEVGLQTHLNNPTGAHAATAISATWTNVQVSLDSVESAIQNINVGSGFATTAQVSQEVLVHNADASAHSTKFANYYDKSETNATIEAAIAAIPAPSVNQTVTVTAGEALTAGQVVSLINESGTMKAYNSPLTVSTSPNGAESVFEGTGATTYISSCVLDSTRVAVAFSESASNAKVRIGTVSGSSITWGTALTVYTGALTYTSICKIDTDKLVLALTDAGGTRGLVFGLTVSGTDVSTTVGASVFSNGTSPTYINIISPETNKILLTYKGASDYGKSEAWTLSETTWTKGSVVDFNAAATAYISCSALSSTSAIVAYQDGGNSNYGTAQVLSISGTTITPGTEYVFESASTGYISTGALSSSNCFIFYNDGADGKPKAIIAANSAGTISYGSIYEVTANSCAYHNAVVIDASHALVTYQDNSVGAHKNKIATITGTDISLSSEYTVQSATSAYISSCYLGSNKLAIAYQDAGNSNYGTAVVNTAFNADYSSVRGLSTTGVNSGETATVLLNGTASGLSSITQGQQYWLNTDHTMSTAPVSLAIMKNSSTQTGEVFLGVGKSATEMWFNVDYK